MKRNEMRLLTVQNESETWKKILVLLSQENITQKQRLTELLVNNDDRPGLLEKVEQFHGCFLQHDEAFRLIRNDILNFEKLVQVEKTTADHHLEQINDNEKRLNREMETLEKGFDKLRTEFLEFISFYANA